MSRSVINIKGLSQTSTNQVGSSILSLALGRLPNGAWILWAIFLKWQEIRDIYFSAQTISLNANIRDVDVKNFVWNNIVTRFGVPHSLISDNGLQFDNKAFRRYYCDLGITNKYSISAYPQGNGQVKVVNKVIVNELKKRLDDAKERWVEELPHVLCIYRTTPRWLTGETPFSMAYGVEVVIPIETSFPTLRTSTFTPSNNDELLGKSLDLIEEKREKAMIQLAYYHQKLKQECDANVKLQPLTPGELLLRKVLGSAKNPAWGKLGPNWEGPYRITSVVITCHAIHYYRSIKQKLSYVRFLGPQTWWKLIPLDIYRSIK